MPRNDDDDDDRPRRRPSRDDDDDRPARSRRPLNDDDDDQRSPPKKKGGTGLIIGILVGVFVICCGGGGLGVYIIYQRAKKVVETAGEAFQGVAESEQSRQNLTRIGTAVRAYEQNNGGLPNNTFEVRPKGTRPLLSWRVHILPYLGEDQLYKQFNLQEPWDGPTNIRLLSQMPQVYGTAEVRNKAGAGKTFYRGFSSPRGIFEKPRTPGDPPLKIGAAQIPDGTSNTILVIDAGQSVEWTKPDDLDFSPGMPKPALGGAYPSLQWTMVLMCDGSVRKLRKDVADNTLRWLVDRADGNVIPVGWELP
ncbi:MAG TPA: DUF1559 domain-containing protein [Gemmataceae bacterium]|jgi:hypothetical protein|nr:DUF1559 domain-containing protein [Gemmataceae bacterium]